MKTSFAFYEGISAIRQVYFYLIRPYSSLFLAKAKSRSDLIAHQNKPQTGMLIQEKGMEGLQRSFAEDGRTLLIHRFVS